MDIHRSLKKSACRPHSALRQSARTARRRILQGAIVILQIAGLAHSQAARLNVEGSWDGNFYGGSEFHLKQDGDSSLGPVHIRQWRRLCARKLEWGAFDLDSDADNR